MMNHSYQHHTQAQHSAADESERSGGASSPWAAMEAWQRQCTSMFADPEAIRAMLVLVEHMQRAYAAPVAANVNDAASVQEGASHGSTGQAMQQSRAPGAAARPDDDHGRDDATMQPVAYAALLQRLEQCEQRIAELEAERSAIRSHGRDEHAPKRRGERHRSKQPGTASPKRRQRKQR